MFSSISKFSQSDLRSAVTEFIAIRSYDVNSAEHSRDGLSTGKLPVVRTLTMGAAKHMERVPVVKPPDISSPKVADHKAGRKEARAEERPDQMISSGHTLHSVPLLDGDYL